MKTATAVSLVVAAALLSAAAELPKAPPAPTPGPPAGSVAFGLGDSTRAMIQFWPPEAYKAAEAITREYGTPDSVSGDLLRWGDRGPFTRIMVYHHPERQLFPYPHQDVVLFEVRLKVPADKLAELARFNGSVIVDRTRGTLGARSDSAAHCILALNVAHDVVAGKRDAASARRFYTETIEKELSGKSSRETQALTFVPGAETADPDRPTMERP